KIGPIYYDIADIFGSQNFSIIEGDNFVGFDETGWSPLNNGSINLTYANDNLQWIGMTQLLCATPTPVNLDIIINGIGGWMASAYFDNSTGGILLYRNDTTGTLRWYNATDPTRNLTMIFNTTDGVCEFWFVNNGSVYRNYTRIYSPMPFTDPITINWGVNIGDEVYYQVNAESEEPFQSFVGQYINITIEQLYYDVISLAGPPRNWSIINGSVYLGTLGMWMPLTQGVQLTLANYDLQWSGPTPVIPATPLPINLDLLIKGVIGQFVFPTSFDNSSGNYAIFKDDANGVLRYYNTLDPNLNLTLVFNTTNGICEEYILNNGTYFKNYTRVLSIPELNVTWGVAPNDTIFWQIHQDANDSLDYESGILSVTIQDIFYEIVEFQDVGPLNVSVVYGWQRIENAADSIENLPDVDGNPTNLTYANSMIFTTGEYTVFLYFVPLPVKMDVMDLVIAPRMIEYFFNNDTLNMVSEWNSSTGWYHLYNQSDPTIYLEYRFNTTNGICMSAYINNGTIEFNATFYSYAYNLRPYIVGTNETSYIVGTTGNNVQFNVTDDDGLNYYEIYIDGTVQYVGTLSGTADSIIYNIDGLSLGIHDLLLIVHDINERYRFHHVNITVTPDLPPTVVGPGSFTLYSNTTGNEIQWNASDDNSLASYDIYVNGLPDSGGSLTGSSTNIRYNVDWLPVGNNIINITVYDTAGNNASHSLNVTVIFDVAPIVSTPPDISFVAGVFGNNINWSITDDKYLDTYEILVNGTLNASGSLNGSIATNVVFNVDNFTLGTFNVTIIVQDNVSHVVQDTVIATVSPDQPPVITGPSALNYTEGDTGNYINWTIADDVGIVNYSIYIDGVENITGTNDSIQFNVDGFAIGTYNVTIIAVDTIGQQAQATIIVTVLPQSDTTDPVVSDAPDITIEEGTTGNLIQWAISDNYKLANYSIYINGGLNTTVDLNGTQAATVDFSADSFTAGTYNVTIVVVDLAGNSASDTVIVTVNPATPPPSEPEQIPGYAFNIILLATLVAIALLSMKYKKTFRTA
ncbi:MAG: hypothetical protein ACTSWN_10020, partial [Promethearchaeota archaeon]